MSLEDLERAVKRDLALMAFPKRPWIRMRTSTEGEHVYEVLVVGGGQSGLFFAAQLRHKQVPNVLVVDRNGPDRAGPWETFARMKTLRTPNRYTGPCMGMPNLTVQSWWEAQHGEGSWSETGLTPTNVWADYLHWYKKVLDLEVESETTAGALRWVEKEGFFEVPLTGPNGTRIVRARRVVDASGIEGAGDWRVPAFISDALPKSLYYHTREDIPFEAYRGKRVGVLGAGSSAFDNSVVALEHGATVEQFYRRKVLPKHNLHRWVEFEGFLAHFDALPDADRYRFIRHFLRVGLPTTESTNEALEFSEFTLHPGESWNSIKEVDGRVEVETEQGSYTFDCVILGTGFDVDLRDNPLYTNFVDKICLWSDRYTPPEEEKHDGLLRHPYVGHNFELTEKVAGEAPYISNLFNFTLGVWINHGLASGTIAGFTYSAPKLVEGITRSLWLEDRKEYWDDFTTYLDTGILTMEQPPYVTEDE